MFFDNLVVNLKHGPLLEQQDYDAFGMEIPGLSTQAFKYQYNPNRYTYNGIEYDSAIGFDQYEAHFRDLDPQLGRWWQIDPKPEMSVSPYAAMGNNPVLKNDPLGDTIIVNSASLKLINSRAADTFGMDKKGDLTLLNKEGSPGYSTYYRDKLIAAIESDSKIDVKIEQNTKGASYGPEGKTVVENKAGENQDIDKKFGGVAATCAIHNCLN